MAKPIIVPLDGSSVAEQALEEALDVARARDLELLLLIVEDAIVLRGFEAFAESWLESPASEYRLGSET